MKYLLDVQQLSEFLQVIQANPVAVITVLACGALVVAWAAIRLVHALIDRLK